MTEDTISKFIPDWHRYCNKSYENRILKKELQLRDEEIAQMKESKFWKLRVALKKVKDKFQ